MLEFKVLDTAPIRFAVDALPPVALEVEQHFADVVVSVPELDLEVDGPTGDGGSEFVLLEGGSPVTVELKLYAAPSTRAQVRVIAHHLSRDDEMISSAWRAMTAAGEHFAVGEADQFRVARRHFVAAAQGFQDIGESRLAAHATYAAAATSRLLQEYDFALQLYGIVLDFAGADPFLRARTLHMRGIIHSIKQNLTDASADYEDAISRYQQMAIDRRVADVEIDRCLNLRLMGNADQGIQCLSLLEQHLVEQQDFHRASFTANNLGRALLEAGRIEEALASHERAAAHADRLSIQTDSTRRAKSDALVLRAHILRELGADHAALVAYLQGWKLLGTIRRRDRAVVLLSVALIYGSMGYVQLGEAVATVALQEFDDLDLAGNQLWAQGVLARLRAYEGDTAGAQTFLQDAAGSLEQTSGNVGLLVVMAKLEMRVCLELDDLSCLKRGLESARKALAAGAQDAALPPIIDLAKARIAQSEKNYPEAIRHASKAAEAAHFHTRLPALLLLGTVEDAAGDRAAGADWFRRANEELERSALRSPRLLPNQSRLRMDVARRLVDAVVEETADSAVVAEQLLSLAAGLGTAREGSLVDPATAQRRRDAAQRLSTATLLQGEQAVHQIIESLLEIEQTSVYVAAGPAQKLPVLQSQIPPGGRLIAYLFGNRQLVALSITPGEVLVEQLGEPTQILSLAALWRRSLVTRASDEPKRAQELGDLLLPGNLCCSGSDRLFVYDTGELSAIPFSALMSAADSGRLMEDQGVARLASLVTRERREASAGFSFSGFGDPVFGPPDPRLPASAAAAEPALMRLNGSDAEWSSLQHRVPDASTASFVGFDVGRERFLSVAGQEEGVLHLATHAFGSDHYGLGSGMFLSRYREDGSLVEGFVSSIEVATSAVAADLVVLSACDTGVTTSGLTMADAFIRAGASAVVATLWPVSNRASRELMEQFYSRLVNAHSAEDALIAAQRAVAQHGPWSAPYFWAAFELHSDGL